MASAKNRRAILAGAASLPAMSVPAVAVGDPELFAIGEKMRPLIGPYFEAKKKSDAAYRQASNAVYDEDFRLADQEGRLTMEDRNRYSRRHAAVLKRNGGHVAFRRMCKLSEKIEPLAERAYELEATTLAGVGVLAAAALFQGGFSRSAKGP